MPRAVVEHVPIAAAAREQPALDRVARLLERVEERPRLVGPRGEDVEVPASLFAVLADVVEHLRRGDGVAVVPYHRELTTQQAADLLNISRPYLVRLLDEGCIAYRRLGTHRRLKLGDVVAYKARRDAERRSALDDLAALSQEAGLYGVARRRSTRSSA
jgi:excisionase family DNA binding protein